MRELLERLLRIGESVVDFPREDLDLSIWDKKNSVYTLKPDIKKKILAVLNKYPNGDLVDSAAANDSGEKEINITGSICTNQYADDSDIDIHIVFPEESEHYGDEEFQDEVNDWFKEEENLESIEGHPVEVYVQFNPNQELMSDGCYNIITDEWIKGPRKVPMDYDPYKDFSGIFDELRNSVKDADLLFGELRRDIIDYDTMKEAMTKLPKNMRKQFLDRLKEKLKEIEDDIQELYRKRKDMVQARKAASQPSTPEEAMKLAKTWKDKNAVFKFISRYRYLRIIKELEKLIDDGINQKDVEKAKKIVGGIE